MNSEVAWALVRLVVALPAVLGLAYLVIKYGLARRPLTGEAGRRIKVLEQVYLGPKTFLCLVSLGGRYYLLAGHDGGVTLVKEMDELPGEEGAVAGGLGEAVEITPRTVEELDRWQRKETGAPGRTAAAAALAGRWGQWLGEAAKKAAGGAWPALSRGKKTAKPGGRK